jgi:hypothetical protein
MRIHPMARALAAVCLSGGVLMFAAAPVAAAPPSGASPNIRCASPAPPSWFYPRLRSAARSDASIPDTWGNSADMARIVCYESSYRVHASNGDHWGLGQMTSANIAYYNVSWDHYWNGSANHTIAFYQLLAALRYCKDRYGSPAAGWQHEINYGWW